MIHIFWDLNFLCDYLSPDGLLSNSVTYRILLNKLLLILTNRVSQWNQNDYDLTLKPHTVQLYSVCAVYCIYIASPVLLRPVQTNSFGEMFDLTYVLRLSFGLQSSPGKLNQAQIFFCSSKALHISVCLSAVTCTLGLTSAAVCGN